VLTKCRKVFVSCNVICLQGCGYCSCPRSIIACCDPFPSCPRSSDTRPICVVRSTAVFVHIYTPLTVRCVIDS
jgi:hypothetical protein